MEVLAVAVGGALGAVLRYLLAHVLTHGRRPSAWLPVGTLIANTVGCFVLGLGRLRAGRDRVAAGGHGVLRRADDVVDPGQRDGPARGYGGAAPVSDVPRPDPPARRGRGGAGLPGRLLPGVPGLSESKVAKSRLKKG